MGGKFYSTLYVVDEVVKNVNDIKYVKDVVLAVPGNGLDELLTHLILINPHIQFTIETKTEKVSPF